jgi:energy-coupling factor transporter ATP-binding protein EcfA2
MIESLRIENFRCFKALELSGLRTVNVVVGENASGKSTLLEAVRIGLAGVPGILSWTNNTRGLQMILPPNPTQEQFRALWVNLFYEFNDSAKILIETQDSQDSQSRGTMLKIFYDPTKAITTQPSLTMIPSFFTAPTTIIPLALERTDMSAEKSVLLATINPQGGLYLEPGPELKKSCGFFGHVMFGSAFENASWFSELSIAKRNQEILEVLQKHFPYVRNLSTEIILGAYAIYADVPYLSKKINVVLISGGMNRLLSFILAVVTLAKGVVLIDELENGIFHDQLGRVWDTLVSLAIQHDTQLFVSTHSYECLRAAVPVIKKNSSDFCFLRTEKKNAQANIRIFSGSELEAALEKGGEVRDRG